MLGIISETRGLISLLTRPRRGPDLDVLSNSKDVMIAKDHISIICQVMTLMCCYTGGGKAVVKCKEAFAHIEGMTSAEGGCAFVQLKWCKFPRATDSGEYKSWNWRRRAKDVVSYPSLLLLIYSLFLMAYLARSAVASAKNHCHQ